MQEQEACSLNGLENILFSNKPVDMELNKFEREIQRKMDELRIKPSDSVWPNIEARIEKNKRPKRILLLLFLFVFIFLSGAYWLWNIRQHTVPVEMGIVKAVSKNNNHWTPIPEQKHAPSQVNSNSKKINENFHYKRLVQIGSHADFPTHLNSSFHKKIKSKITSIVKASLVMSDEKIDKNIHEKNDNNSDKFFRVETDSDDKEDKSSDITERKVIADSVSKSVDVNNGAKPKKDTSKISNVTVKKIKTTTTNKWRFGLTFIGGISGINNIFGNNSSYLPIPSNLNSNLGSVYYMDYRTIIKQRSGFSFGFVEEKNISSKSSISLGLSFRALAYGNVVGNKNDTTGFYNAQNATHTFNAHFNYIDLPAGFTIQFRKNKSLPIALKGEIVFSQLIYSNALQFNSYTGNYYHDNSILNKTQLGLNTSASVKVFSKQKTSLLIGSYFYYGASQIAKEGLYYKRHFVFTALRAEFLF
jgi:hypothetical protein